MKEIKVAEFRAILAEVVDNGSYEMVKQIPDDKLLKMNFYSDLGLVSLDVEDMCCELFNNYGIIVNIYGHHPLTRYSFENEPTVENFIETVNYCASQEKWTL